MDTPRSPMDLSRPRLKELAAWIRDDLDPLVAREGPDVLRPDDALSLHELFLSLRSTPVTAMDLRATGIHRAVMEVAGIATRWPRRLVDACDRLVDIWSAKFGRLEDLHPFLYGRGGRLEGIASVAELSDEALVERWRNTCPERITPKVSHLLGPLDFKAGAWWINPLFAVHSGITDLDSATKGGVCFDRHGAYAVVLLHGEIEVTPESNFTYRCKMFDKGKYRLTSANPKSREPIRVLRAHSLNSVLGPKAGIRYDGLHRVAGWAVYTAKKDDTIGKSYKEGDLLFEVKFERADPTPMEEVLKHPTAAELDDFAEYKRLRRIYREERRKGGPGKGEPSPPSKDAPPTTSGHTIASQLRSPSAMLPQSPSRMPTRPDQVVATPDSRHFQGTPGGTPFSLSPPPDESDTYFVTPAPGREAVPDHVPSHPRSSSDSPPSDQKSRALTVKSTETSKKSGQSHLGDIREVAPWIDYDLELVTAAPSINSRPIRAPPSVEPAARGILARAKTRKKSESQSLRSFPVPSAALQESDKHSTKSHEGMRKPELADQGGRRTLKKAISRSRNPLVKLFDGAAGVDEQSGDYLPQHGPRAASFSCNTRLPTIERRLRASSSDSPMRPICPIPLRPLSPLSSLITTHRHTICFPAFSSTADHGTMLSLSDTPPHVAVTQYAGPRLPPKTFSLPVTLEEFISSGKAFSPKRAIPADSTHVSPVRSHRRLVGTGSF